MRSFADKRFENLFDHGKRLSLVSMRFERCTFANCILSRTTDVERRSTVGDVHLKGCVATGCNIGPAVFENCSVEGLETDNLLIIWGALFKHVTLAGDLGSIKINQFASGLRRDPDVQRPFDIARTRFYASVDWALDISAAKFKSFDVRGIPARLFRLDLDTQAVVKRENAAKHGWQDRISEWNSLWPFAIGLFLEDGDEDMVLVTPLGAPKQERDGLLRGIKELRDLGVAEPI
jgi:hypothetical protein